MSPPLQLFVLMLTLICSVEASAVNSQKELQAHTQKAHAFLCARGFCLKNVPPVDLVEVNGYLGYVDGNFSRISVSPNLNDTDTQLALVHELTHIYRGERAPAEEKWLSEGLAKFMEFKYSTVWPVSYITRLNHERFLDFSDYRPGGNGYMSSFLLVLYLYNHFGEEKFFQKVMHSKKAGWENVLSAIEELVAEGSVKIPSEFITKESILRHFAVSLWVNDPFAARYALFYLDPKYEALNARSTLSANSAVRPPEEGMFIHFPKVYPPTPADEVYSILKYTPFEIKAADRSDAAEVFISIRH